MTKNSFHIKSEWYRNPEISVCSASNMNIPHQNGQNLIFCQNWCKIFNFRETWVKKYSYFPESLRLEMLEESRKMFTFGYDSYMKYAFPKDELDPIHCTGMIFNDTVWKFNNFLADEILRENNLKGMQHWWKNSIFSRHSDFTWNQFWRI